MREIALDNFKFQKTVLASMSSNGKVAIYQTTDPDGKKWNAGCQVKETRL
jgi:hypothetical protein